MSAQDRSGRVRTRSWRWRALCWCIMGAVSPLGYGQAAATDATQKPTPRAWIQRYLGVSFPDSARHFAVYYRSADKDVVLFSFDIAADDLPRLLNETGVFPPYATLVRGDSGVRSDVAGDSGSLHFAQRVAGLRNAFSATKVRANAAQPLELQLWTAEVSVGTWRVYVSVITDKHADETIARSSFQMPAVPRSVSSWVVVNSPLVGRDATRIWQRWNLDLAGYRHLMQTVETAGEAVRYDSMRAEALAERLNARGPDMGVSWWKPSELMENHAGGRDSVQGFCWGGADASTALVLGRVDGLFRCYAYTQCHILTPDPCDAIWAWVGLSLPTGARNASYESSSTMAGLVAWIRFDLPLRDLATCLAQASALPSYAEFVVDAVAKKHLEASYQTDAPPWWCPQELNEGLYAQRRTNTKELAEVCVGLGHLSPEIARVYIGLFSPW